MNTQALAVLKEGYTKLPKGDQAFAYSLLEQWERKATLSDKQWLWVGKLADAVEMAEVPDFTKEMIPVGEFGGVIALFDKAKKYLKHPSIVLQTPGGQKLMLKMAGNGSKAPGTISITDGGAYGDSKWFGRVTKDGEWEIGKVTEDLKNDLTTILAQLAKAPAETAAAYGKLTGRCCFCLGQLTDKRSTAVGYGKVCAQRWHLPWGQFNADKKAA